MKKSILLIACFIVFSLDLNAQVTREFAYQTDTLNKTWFYNFAYTSSGVKYVFWDFKINPGTLNLYNTNHSLYKIISLPTISGNEPYYDVPVFITDSLFDTDGMIEYLLSSQDTSTNISYVRVFKEDGTMIFSEPNANRYCFFQYESSGYYISIFPTESGTKMVLCVGDSTIFYSLPGTLPSGFLANPVGSNASLSHPFPNPSSNAAKVFYKLPNGQNKGEIVFYNLQGSEVKRFQVDNTFDHLQLDNSDLPSGTYLYQLFTTQGMAQPKKMAVIR